jgi:hypothetical protein
MRPTSYSSYLYPWGKNQLCKSLWGLQNKDLSWNIVTFLCKMMVYQLHRLLNERKGMNDKFYILNVAYCNFNSILTSVTVLPCSIKISMCFNYNPGLENAMVK